MTKTISYVLIVIYCLQDMPAIESEWEDLRLVECIHTQLILFCM